MKIKPTIRGPKNFVDFADLETGDTFIYHNQLWIKSDDTGDYQQTALNLATGEWEYDMCNTCILPVDAVITWIKQKE